MASNVHYLTGRIAKKIGVNHTQGLCLFECIKQAFALETPQAAVAKAMK
jgi:hypothetical protein